jgi:hypothetical protein
MPRCFGLLILAAIVLGLYLLVAPEGEMLGAAGQALGAPVATSAWAIGLFMGLALAWLAGRDWRNLPSRVMLWVALQRRRLVWMLLGGLCAGVLMLL